MTCARTRSRGWASGARRRSDGGAGPGRGEVTAPGAISRAQPAPDPLTRAPGLAFLSYASGECGARTPRMARSAVRGGFEVVVYARLQDGRPEQEERDG